jgi:TolB-like protein/tetratricopeptide (TPR) repeat protein
MAEHLDQHCGTHISPDEARVAVTNLAAAEAFQHSPQLQRLLRFLAAEALEGRGPRLKEYVLGVEVFGRPATYDPRLDSIVRVEAHRLRAALEEYYRGDGSEDSIVFDLPKGTYQPSFRRRETAASVPSPPPLSPVSSPWKWKRLAMAAVLVIIAVAGSVYYLRQQGSAHEPNVRTIAVLPFENLSADPENEYFCFGLMEEITTELAKMGGVRVVARTSAAHFKRGDDIATIARRLNVDAIVEGSVFKSNDRMRVTVQLINAADTVHLWSETYERGRGDLISVQDEIAHLVTDALRQRLGRNTTRTPRHVQYSSDSEANQLYWRAFYLRTPMGRTNWRKDLSKSAGYLERAIQRDPGFAPAYAALADNYISLAWERGGGPTTRDLMTRGRNAATRALELDETLAEAYSSLGTVQFFFDYDPKSAEKSYQRALQLEPNNGKVRMWYAYALVMQRRGDEAIAQARQARELDPLSYIATTHLAVVMYFSRHYEEAMKLVGETLEVADIAPAHGLRGMILEAQRKYGEAIVEYHAGLRLVPTHSYIKGMMGHAYGRSGEVEQATRLLRDTRLDFDQGGLSDLKVAYIYMGLGDWDQALQHLERDYEQRDPELPYVNADPVFDPVRGDPRFTALLKKMGLGG